MRFNSTASLFLSLISSMIGFLLLFYFFLPFFLMLITGILIYVAIVYIWSKITGKPTNFNIKVVKINPYQNFDSSHSESNNSYLDNSIIDSTTTEKEKNKE